MTEFSYVVSTDSTADLPWSFYQEHEVPFIPMLFTVDGKEYRDCGECPLSNHAFYDLVRSGQMPSTAQVTAMEFEEFAEPFLQAGKDVLHINFSSGLSGSFHSCLNGAAALREKYPDRKILVLDSLAASMGEGLLVYHTVKNREAGMTIEENAKWFEDNKLHLCHCFTVDDLHHLHRGGRVSKASAIMGSLLGVKPVLHVDDEGHLILVEKVRGRAASLDKMAEHMEKTAIDPAQQTVFISHGDCLKDAQALAQKVRERLGVKEVLLNPIGPVIGAHSGPGTVALFFLGTKR